MEKRIPSIVGPWLAGTFDRDRVVSRAAGDGLSSLLDTKEKENKFWTRCQGQILKYATDAMLETPDTLSDEKSTNKEDALAKYYRAIGGSLSLIFGLVNRADLSGIEQELSRYLEVEAVWVMAAAEEPFVRRTLFQLLQTLLDKKPEVLRPRLTQIGRALVADSFKSSQSGSATDLTKALAKLTRLFPEAWGTKTHPLQRLRPFVEKGSQGGSPIYWEALDHLLKVLPEKTTSAETAIHFLKSLRIGITNRLEPRSNATQGWITYINTFERLLGVISPDVSFVKEAFYPLVRQYLHPSPELITWTSPTPTALSSKVWKILANHADANIRNSAGEEWQGFQESFLLRLTNSLPEVSKEYQSSQQSVATDGERWFSLSGGIMEELGQGTNDGGEAFLRNAIAEASTTVLRGALDLLIRRKYKPFGAASVIQAAFTKSPSLCVNDEFVLTLFPTGSPDKLKLLVSSPSFAYLIPCLDALSTLRHDKFSQIWPELVDSALQCDAETSASAANKLISVAGATALAQHHEQLQAYLASQWLGCAGGKGSPLSWSLCESSLTFSTINDESLTSVIADTVRRFDVAGNTSSSLKALELITNHKPTLVSQHKAAHVELVTKLLALTEIDDNAISGRAASLQAHLDQKSAGQSPLVGVIQSHLEDAGASSIGYDYFSKHLSKTVANYPSIDVLIQRAVATFKSGGVPLEELFPSTNTWLSELAGFLRSAPKASVSLTSAMGGAYFLVRSGDEGRQNPPRRDGKGRSIPARMAVYTSTLLSSGVPSSSLPEAFHLELLYLTALTGELAADQLTTLEADGLWGIIANETDASTEVEEFVTSCRDLLNGVAENTTSWRTGDLSGTTVAERLLNLALQHAQDLTPTSLYSAKVFSNLLQALVESQGIPSQLDEWLGKLGVLKVTPNTVFPAIACLVGFGEVLASSELTKNLCNRLVSEMIGALPGAARTLYSIVLLNVCIAVFEPGQVPVDTRKQTLALKQITSWMATPDEMGSSLTAEACKWIQRIFPSVKGIYGPYWEQTLDYCVYLWTKKAPRDAADARLPYVHASLKLIGCIMDEEDKNEDLEDALSQRVEAISKGLIELLKVPTQMSQAGQIVDSLVARMVGNVPLEHVGDLSELYGLVASDSSGVQSAAFRILHRALPAVQAKLSVDVLLDKRGRLAPIVAPIPAN
jgi:E3 ubiquitin-protein ligase listerin